MMCIHIYVSVTLRNVAVTSRRNVASMMWIRRASYILSLNALINIYFIYVIL